MPMLDAVLAEADVGLDAVGALAVTVGPGTFTGLRVGLAAARGMALARALPLVGVTTLEAIAEPVEANEGEAIAAAFDARRGEIYLQLFDLAHRALCAPTIVALDEAPSHVAGGPVVIVGTGAALLADVLSARGVAWRLSGAAPQPDALGLARLAARRLAADGAERYRLAPGPLYLRAPDAKLPGGLDLAAPRASA